MNEIPEFYIYKFELMDAIDTCSFLEESAEQ